MVKHFHSVSSVGRLQMNPADARILMGRSWEERLPSKMNVHGEFPESRSSWWYPDSFIAQVGFIFLAEESEGAKILGFLGTCDPKLLPLCARHQWKRFKKWLAPSGRWKLREAWYWAMCSEGHAPLCIVSWDEGERERGQHTGCQPRVCEGSTLAHAVITQFLHL